MKMNWFKKNTSGKYGPIEHWFAKSGLDVEEGKHANYGFSIHFGKDGSEELFSLYYDDGNGNGDFIDTFQTLDAAMNYAMKVNQNLMVGKI